MKVAIIGSAIDSGYSEQAREMADAIGRECADRGHVVLYGPEPAVPSLSYFAAKAAKERGGLTVAIANGGARTKFYDPSAAGVVIYTEGAFGATREVIFVNSADAVISIGGGSGTLTEMGIAYMNFIPIVAMKGSGGWSDQMIGKALDERKKFIIPGAASAAEALDLAEKMHGQFQDKPTQYEGHYALMLQAQGKKIIES